MIDSERILKIKVRSRWMVFKISLTSAIICIKNFSIEIRLPNILKTTKVTKLAKAILESSNRVLQVTCKLKQLKRPVFVVWSR